MRRLLAPLLAIAFACSAQAQDASDADALRLARLVVENSGMARAFRGLTEAMRADILRTAVTRPDLAGDLQAALADLQPDIDAEVESMTTKAAAIYAQKLSRRELADCAVFFAGASGKAYVAAQPAILADLGAVMENWRRATSIALTTRLREKLRARGKDF